MVIAKFAVESFLEREGLYDLRDLKKPCAAKGVRRYLKKTHAAYFTKPFQHQRVCLAAGLKLGRALFFLGMGAGKTKLSLDLILNLRRQGRAKRALILVPAITNIYEWQEQAKIHAPSLSVMALTGHGKAERYMQMFDESSVVIATYQGVVALCSTRQEPTKRKAASWKPDKKILAALTKHFQIMFLDESDTVKNSQGLYFRICRALSKGIRYRFALTGTPIERSPLDLWAQFFVIDRGESLGETIGLFRSAFFTEKEKYWGGHEYTFKEKRRPDLDRMIANAAISYSEEECQDLPPFFGGLDAPAHSGPIIKNAAFPAETLAYYEKFLEKLKAARSSQSEEERRGIQSTYATMRMLSSGYLGTRLRNEDGEAGEKVEVVFSQNPKLELLIETLRQIPEKEKVIVVAIYHKSGDLVEARLKKEGISFSRLYSKTRDKKTALASFKDPKGPRVLLGSTSIAYGLNLQGVSRYMFFYESPDSIRQRKQMERRIRRTGATKPCYYFDFQIYGSLDHRILDGLRKGKSFLDSLLRGKVKL